MADERKRPAGPVRPEFLPVIPGNAPLFGRPEIPNGEGTSTVFSSSYGDLMPGKELLLPLADEHRIQTDGQAEDKFRRTGQHLGAFETPQDASMYADWLHGMYERGAFQKVDPIRDALAGILKNPK